MHLRRHRAGWLVALALAFLLAGCDPAGEEDPDEPPAAPADIDVEELDAAFRADPDCFGIEPTGLDPEGVECGTVEVPLHYDDPDGQTIELAVVVAPGSAEDDYEHPLLVLGGGPGEVVVETFLSVPGYRQILDVGPQIIVMDQRGVGASTPALECPETSDAESPTALDDPSELLGPLRECRSRLADDGIDLDGFNHLANARDVSAVRHALGHDQVDVRGGSYGSQLALLAAQHDPDGIRSLVLNSPVDPTGNWVDGVAVGFERALDRLAEACAVDEACAGEVGDLHEALAQTVGRLAEQPQEVTVQPPGGDEVTATYTPTTFLDGLFLLFYLPEGVSSLPALVALARDGVLEPLAQIVALLEQELEGLLSAGMHFSMLCSAEGALATPEASLGELRSELIAEHWAPFSLVGGEPLDAVCGIWDVELAYDPDQQHLDIDVPTLIVTGAFDHVTPPELGRQIHAVLPTSHLIEVPDAGHAPLEALGLCGQEILGRFLADPTSPPEDACATDRQLQLITERAQAPG